MTLPRTKQYRTLLLILWYQWRVPTPLNKILSGVLLGLYRLNISQRFPRWYQGNSRFQSLNQFEVSVGMVAISVRLLTTIFRFCLASSLPLPFLFLSSSSARVGRVSKSNVTAPKTFSAWLFLSPERLISLSLRNVFKSSTLGFLEMSSTLLQFSKYCAFAKENQHAPWVTWYWLGQFQHSSARQY